MKNTLYEQGFNANEMVILGMIIIGGIIVIVLPKILSKASAVFSLLFGVTTGLMFDHTLAVPPLDLYDVNDQSIYQTFDMFSYLMYAPFGYIFIYIYRRFNIKGWKVIPYILGWTALAILVEVWAIKVGIFHFKNGYRSLYSIPIYLFVQSVQLFLYEKVFMNHDYDKGAN
ncbi:hypothetical protein [Cytobacillus gottheilii]|uniref:hypothetical protein n=1 Tax=Cytobacillus gottheilii TaxID=859144 RepID=UPI000834C5D6|nr:hypothetical protein [Cytobacillus gottheilii]